MGPLGNVPDGWLFHANTTPRWRGDLHEPYFGTTDHDFIVQEWNSKWRVIEPSGRTVQGENGGHRLFSTAGAACRAANELGIEAA